MIYFDETTKRKLVQRLYEFLEPGGYLIISRYRISTEAQCRLFMSDRQYSGKNKYREEIQNDEKNKSSDYGDFP